MKETNYWQQFLQTGHIEDYLSYCAGLDQADSDRGSKKSGNFASSVGLYESRKNNRGQEGTGYAGMRDGDGSGAKG